MIMFDRSAVTRFSADLPVGALATFSFRVIHVGLEFLTMLLFANLLGVAAFGVYAIAMSCATVLGVPAAAGFDRLLIREVAALRAAERWGALRGILQRATQAALASSALLALALAGFAQWVWGAASLRDALWLAAVLLPLVAFARLRQAALQGLGRVPSGLFPETIVQPASALVLAALAFSASGLPRVGANAVAVQVAAALIAMIVGVLLLRRAWPSAAKSVAPTFETARWLGSAAPLMWMLGMNMVLVGADTIMLGWMLDESIAGKYRVAAQMAMLVSFPMTAINLAVAPILARSFSLGDSSQLRQSAAKASRWSLLAAAAIAFPLLVTGRWLLGLFGGEFVDAYPALAVLSAGYLVSSASGAAGYLLIMTRHERAAAWIFSGAAIVNVVANYLLIPPFGALGAAVATAGSVALVAIGLWFFSRRVL